MWFSRELQRRMNVFIARGGGGVLPYMGLSFQFQMSKKEREIYEFEMNEEFVCLPSNLSYYNIISA